MMCDENKKNIATIISSILISNTKRMTIKQLDIDFERTEGYKIPYQKFGCATLEQFLRTLNDKVVVCGSGMYAEVQVIVSSKTAHINELISKQRQPKPKRPSRSGNKRYYPSENRRTFNYHRNTPPSLPSPHIQPLLSYRPPVISNNTPVRPPDSPVPLQNTRPSPSNTTERISPDSSNKGAIPKSPTYKNESSTEDTLYYSDEDDVKNTNVPQMVQNKLLDLVIQHPDGILCSKIVELYRKQYSETLSYSDYGYRSIAQMCVELRHLFNIVQLDKSEIKLFDKRKPIPQHTLNIVKKLQLMKIKASTEAPTENALPEAGVEEIMSEIYSETTPPDVLEFGAQLEQQWIDPGTNEQDYIDVNVGEVYDPSKFWINLVPYVQKLNILMDSMQNYYGLHKQDLTVPYFALKNDLYIACTYSKEYHRARIVDVSMKDRSQIKVYFVDYGTVGMVHILDVCYLHKQFTELPAQAIRARLAGICPATINEQWSRAAAARFLSLVAEKDLLAQIVRIDEEKKILDIVMADTNEEDEDFFINDALVAMDYACFTFQDRKPAEDTEIVPIVRYIHLFPTHYELENGLVPSAVQIIYMHNAGFGIEQMYPHYFKNARTGLLLDGKQAVVKKHLPVDYDIERRYCEAYGEDYDDANELATNDVEEEGASAGLLDHFISPTGASKSHWEDIIDEAESIETAVVGVDSNGIDLPSTNAQTEQTTSTDADDLSEKIRNVVRQFIEKELSPIATNNSTCTQTDDSNPDIDDQKQAKVKNTKTKVYQTNTFTQINVAPSNAVTEDPSTAKPMRPPPGYSNIPANRSRTTNASPNNYVTNQTYINFPVHYNHPCAFASPIGYFHNTYATYQYNAYNNILRNIQYLINCGYRLTPEQQNYLQSFNWDSTPAYLRRENVQLYDEAPPPSYPDRCASAQNAHNAHHNPNLRQKLVRENEPTNKYSLNPIAATFIPDDRTADVSKSADRSVQVEEEKREYEVTEPDIKEEKSAVTECSGISNNVNQSVRANEEIEYCTIVSNIKEETSAVRSRVDPSTKYEVIESVHPSEEIYVPTVADAQEEIACDTPSSDGPEANTNESQYSENERTLPKADDGVQKCDERAKSSNMIDDHIERKDHKETIVLSNNNILEHDSVYDECESNSIYSDSCGTKLITSISVGRLNLHVVILENEYYFLLSELSKKIFSKFLTALHIRKLFVASPCTISIVDIRLKKHPELKKELLMYDLIKETETTVDGVPIRYFEELVKVIPMVEYAHGEVTNLLEEIDCLLSEHGVENKY